MTSASEASESSVSREARYASRAARLQTAFAATSRARSSLPMSKAAPGRFAESASDVAEPEIPF